MRRKLVYLLMVCLIASPAIAANFDQNSVILLPNNDRARVVTPDQNIVTPKGPVRQDDQGRNVPGQNVVVVPGGRQDMPAGQQNNQTVTTTAQPKSNQVSSAYAVHIFTGPCAQQIRDELGPQNIAPALNQRYWDKAQSGCKCLANEVMASTSAEGLFDYVMYNYGYQDESTANDPLAQAYFSTPQSGQIGDFISSPDVRKKCGL